MNAFLQAVKCTLIKYINVATSDDISFYKKVYELLNIAPMRKTPASICYFAFQVLLILFGISGPLYGAIGPENSNIYIK